MLVWFERAADPSGLVLTVIPSRYAVVEHQPADSESGSAFGRSSRSTP